MFRFSLILLSLLLLPAQIAAEEGDWGDFSARFVFDGVITKPKNLVVNVDVAAFTEPIYDESLVVNIKNRGIANILVWVRTDRRTKIAIHSSYEKTAKAKVKLGSLNGQVLPHVLLLRTSQTVLRKNNDKVAHHLRIHFFAAHPT